MAINISFLTLLLLTFAIIDVLSVPSESLPKRTCGTIVKPADVWQIRQEQPDQSYDFGTFTNGTAIFETAQAVDAVNQSDIVVSFKNMPCPPLGVGPFAVEFLYESTPTYSYCGQTRIDMFAVSNCGPLPGLPRSGVEAPTWNNMNSLRGSLIGTFSLPIGPDAKERALIDINQLVCQQEMNMRFSITNDDMAAGEVYYPMIGSTGLRIRYGC